MTLSLCAPAANWSAPANKYPSPPTFWLVWRLRSPPRAPHFLTAGREVGNVPAVEPLNAEFFRGETAQTAASWNEFLHRVLFASRSRFFHKLRILSETLQSLAREYNDAAADVAAGASVQPGDSWDALECLHYDFTTCLREMEVVLKSFLRVLAGRAA